MSLLLPSVYDHRFRRLKPVQEAYGVFPADAFSITGDSCDYAVIGDYRVMACVEDTELRVEYYGPGGRRLVTQGLQNPANYVAILAPNPAIIVSEYNPNTYQYVQTEAFELGLEYLDSGIRAVRALSAQAQPPAGSVYGCSSSKCLWVSFPALGAPTYGFIEIDLAAGTYTYTSSGTLPAFCKYLWMDSTGITCIGPSDSGDYVETLLDQGMNIVSQQRTLRAIVAELFDKNSDIIQGDYSITMIGGELVVYPRYSILPVAQLITI